MPTKVTRTSMISGITRTREIDIDPQQYEDGMILWRGGLLIQDAFPELSQADCEFIKTGITDGEWDEIMSEDDWEEHA